MVLFASPLLRKTSSEEWPEMIEEWPSSVHGKAGEVRRVKMKTEPPEPKIIDLRNIGTKDLMYIKKQDPFLYYSIPEVRNAKTLGRDVDPSAQPPRTAKRSSCISFECHPDLLFEDLLSDLSLLDDEDASMVSELSNMDERQDSQEDEDFDVMLRMVHSAIVAPRRVSS